MKVRAFSVQCDNLPSMSRRCLPKALPLLLLLSSCPQKTAERSPRSPDGASPIQPAKPTDPAVADIPLDPQAAVDQARLPRGPSDAAAEITVRVIVVGFGDQSRDEAQALRRAKRLVDVARQQGSDFAELARRYSDGPNSGGGSAADPSVRRLAWPATELPFGRAAFSLGVGQVGDPIRGADAYYVVERIASEQLSSAHILVMYRGAKLAPPGLKRNKEAALAYAKRILRKAQHADTDFAILASRNSDSPSKARGGVIAPISAGRLLPGFEPYFEALKAAEPGTVIPQVVETPYGFHVVKRLTLRKILVQHILVAFVGSRGKAKERRTRGAAKKLIQGLEVKLRRGADFDGLAREHSDDGSAENGGRLPPFGPGEQPIRFEQFAFSLKVGQVSGVVESLFGFHLIKRLR